MGIGVKAAIAGALTGFYQHVVQELAYIVVFEHWKEEFTRPRRGTDENKLST